MDPDQFEENKLFVRLPKDFSEDMLKDVLRNYNCKRIFYKEIYAIVQLESKADAERAIREISLKPPWNLVFSFAKKKTLTQKNGTSYKDSKSSSYNASGFNSRTNNNRDIGYSVVSSNSSTSGLDEKFTQEFHAWYNKEGHVIERIMQSSHTTIKDFLISMAKQLLKGKAYTDRPQYKDELVVELGKVFDSLALPLTTAPDHNNQESFESVSPSYSNIKETETVKPRISSNNKESETVKPRICSSNSETETVKPKIKSNVCVATDSSTTLAISRTFNAWFYTPGKSMNLQIVKKCKDGIICLAMDVTDDTMRQKYESLFDEFANCCNSIKGNETPVPDTIMAVEVSKGVWYRALLCAEGWALLDEGGIAPLDQVSRAIHCPVKYKNIPEFVCCFVCDPISLMEKVDTSLAYSVEFVRKNEEDRTLNVKVRSSNNLVELDGTMKLWKLSPIPNKKDLVKQPMKETEKPTHHKRISIIESVNVGDKLTISITKSDSLGQMCVMANDSDPTMAKHYISLIQELADACELEKSSPPISGRVMAVKVTSEQAWYRCVSVLGGLALLDDGRTLTMEDVDKCVLCPKQYDNVPEFCVLLTNVVPLKQSMFYVLEILSKSGNKANVKITSKDDPSIQYNGRISPFVEFREEPRVAQLIEERVNNSAILNTLQVSSLSKLKIETDSQVLLVNHYKEKCFLRQNNAEARKVYLQLLDELTLSGPKLPPVSSDLEKDDLVICKYDGQYHRAVVEQSHPNAKEYSLYFFDIGCKDTVHIDFLKVVPVCAVEAPIMTDCFTLADVDKNAMCSAATTKYLVNLIDKRTPLKCQSLYENQVVLQMSDSKQTLNEVILDINTPNWKKLMQNDGILRAPVLMEHDMGHFEIKVGQKLKILLQLEKAVSVSVSDNQMESKLEELTKNFTAYCNAVKDPYLPRISEVCLYKDKKSDTWRRGCAIDVNNLDMVSIASLDHGDAAIVHFSNCRKMLAEFCTPLPFLSVYAYIADIGPDPSDSTFEKTCEVMREMDYLIVDAFELDSLGVYNVKFKGLSAELRRKGII